MTGRRGDPTVPAPAPGAGGVAVRWPLLALVVVVLLASNVVVNRVVPTAAYVPWNLGVAALLVVVARRAGLGWSDLGLHRPTMRRSLWWGVAGAAAVGAVYVLALVLPWTSELFVDARAADRGVPDLLYHSMIQIPLGTVMLEELAFRGLLPAVLGSRDVATWHWHAVLGASVLFGLWHVLPSLDLAAVNTGVQGAVGANEVLAVALAVLGTTVAGVFLCWWRWLGRGLLAPVLVHVATNSLGYAIAWSLTT